jgi:hypothetical protein
MAGVLTHVLIAVIGCTIISLVLKGYRYGLAFALGHFIPDIGFGIIGLKINSLNPATIITTPGFSSLASFMHNALYWIIFAIVIWVGALFLHKYNKLSRKGFKNIILLLVSFLIGVALHLVIDVLVIETSYWI